MSTAAATIDLRDVDARPGLGRLIGVELRKMVDTRAGFWLQLGTLGAMVALVLINVFVGETEDQTYYDMLWAALWPATLLLPVIGVLLVSSEWSQRTATITFVLVPERWRVILAKVGAAFVVAAGALAVSLVLGAVGTAIASPGVDGTWTLEPDLLGQAALYAALYMLMGVAFGAALLSSPPAIVLYFVLPLTWALVASISIFEIPKRWLDTTETLAPLAERSLSSTEWAHVGTTLSLWVALPLAIGIWRIRRSEIA
jgi:ABC-2 type transport system permease protein